MVSELDRAYIAGLFDGEGTIHFKRGMEKKKKHKNKPGYRYSNSLRLSMEIAMTDESVLRWVHQTLGIGTLNKKPRKGLRKDGTPYLMQYRWRATFRDAYLVCLYLWPFAHTKLPKIQQIIEHYAKQKLDCEVIDLNGYKTMKGKKHMNDIEKYKRLQNLFDFVKEEIKLVEDKLVDRALMKRVSDLELSIRSMNTLLNLELKYLKDLVVLSEGDLLRVPNFGRKSLNEVKEVLAELNLKLNMNREDLLNKVQVELGVNRNNYV